MRIRTVFLTTAFLASSTLAHGETTPPAGKKAPQHRQTERLVQRQGKASFYDDHFQGKKTATGEQISFIAVRQPKR